jgi:ABC-type bacteriocin/lantibiotic exporter with double-glycine peptidase domain
MLKLLKLIDIKTYLISIVHLIIFLVRLRYYKWMVTIITNFKEEKIDEFYSDMLKFIFIISCLTLLFTATLILIKRNINIAVRNVYCEISKNLIDCDVTSYEEGDKSVLMTYVDTQQIYESSLGKLLLKIPKTLIYLGYYLYTVYSFSFKMVFVLLSISAINIYATSNFAKLEEKYYELLFSHSSKMRNEQIDRLNNLKHVKMCFTQEKEKNIIENDYEISKTNKNREELLSNGIFAFNDILSDIISYCVVVIGIKYYLMESMTIMELLYLSSHSSNFIIYITSLKDYYYYFYKHQTITEKINNIKNIPVENLNPQIDENMSNKIKNICKLEIVTNNNCKVIADEGKICTITGKNGIGKTTMIYNLLNFNHIDSWNFKINDNELSRKDGILLRNNISFVFQEPKLFDSTVIDNITYGCKDISYQQIIDKSESMNILDWVLDNMDRKIGHNGETLSGGEKKKIQLLHSLLQNRKIYIFDEPTNNLDTDSVNCYINQLAELKKQNKIVIAISHDQRIINLSDNVFTIK